jgi:hypothetical protein
VSSRLGKGGLGALEPGAAALPSLDPSESPDIAAGSGPDSGRDSAVVVPAGGGGRKERGGAAGTSEVHSHMLQ